jgi:hypothetical protein
MVLPVPEEQHHFSFLSEDVPALSAQALPALSDNPLPTVIRAFPWNNGITLLHGSMADTLLSLWETNGVDEIGVQNSLLLVRNRFSLLPLPFTS